MLPDVYLRRYVKPRFTKFVNAGVGSTGTWWALVRLQTDVLAYDPTLIFLDQCINGDDIAFDGVLDEPKEALIRQILTQQPGAIPVPYCLLFPPNYSGMDTDRAHNRNAWISQLAPYYDLQAIDWGVYLAANYLPVGYTDADVDNYLAAHLDVHPNTAGHAIAAILAETINPFQTPPPMPATPLFGSRVLDFMADPIKQFGTDNTGTTGSGWASTGTSLHSSHAGDTVTFTAMCSSFGFITLSGSGTFSWSLNGGGSDPNSPFTLSTAGIGLQTPGDCNFPRGLNAITLKVESGTLNIDEMYFI